MSNLLDIVICTFDREDLLRDCLDSLCDQEVKETVFKVWVVNNNRDPLSHELKDAYRKRSNFCFLDQPTPGLSIARNTGIEASDADWIAFLDDDARVSSDYVKRIIEISTDTHFDCFGGGIRSWWKYGRPRWLAEDYGSKPDLRKDIGEITEGYNWGSNIIFRRKSLQDVGRFPEEIGMKGAHIGYAAENMVQMKLRQQGYVIGYDPSLLIDHVVSLQKLSLVWHIRASFATGRDGVTVFPDQYGIKGMAKTVKKCLVAPFKGVKMLVNEPNYWLENLFLDSLLPISLLMGKLVAKVT